MKKIQPRVADFDIVCAEQPAPPCGVVVFGASGDLVFRKLIGSLYALFCRDLVSEHFYVLGCARTKMSDEEFRSKASDKIQSIGHPDDEKLKAFLDRLFYQDGQYDDMSFYAAISGRLRELDQKFATGGLHVFYLSVPPTIYETIITKLGGAGLSCKQDKSMPLPRLVVEKPFGRDYQSAAALDRLVHTCFKESQVYRIDHYLGKETVQNIMMFRFANSIFEPLWNRNYIDHVQLTISESLGIGHRGGYYDQSGALRDMFQNHLLQMVAMVAMEPPVSFEADAIRDEKVKIFKSIRPFDSKRVSENIVRGQYVRGTVDGEEVNAYLQEQGVCENSTTETFVAARLFVDNWRWQGVPFYCRTGKRLKAKDTEIAITFKKVPHSLFASAGLDEIPANVLVLQIQPQEGIRLSFQAKRPGSKLCMGTLNMDFSYGEVFGYSMPESYQRLLLDCMTGDQTLFTRSDGVLTAWKLLGPVLEAWQQQGDRPCPYEAGSESFPEADGLLEKDGRCWRPIE